MDGHMPGLFPLAGCVPFGMFHFSGTFSWSQEKESYQVIQKQIPLVLTSFDPVNGPLIPLL